MHSNEEETLQLKNFILKLLSSCARVKATHRLSYSFLFVFLSYECELLQNYMIVYQNKRFSLQCILLKNKMYKHEEKISVIIQFINKYSFISENKKRNK